MDPNWDISQTSAASSVESHDNEAKESASKARKSGMPRRHAITSLLRSQLESMFLLSPTNAAASLFMDRTVDGPLGQGATFDVQSKTITKDGQSRVVAIKRLASSYRSSNTTASGHTLDHSVLRPMLRDLVVMETMAKSPFVLDLHDAGFWADSNFGLEPYLLVELSTNGTLAEFLNIRAIGESEDLPTYVASRYADHGYSTRRQLILDVARGLLALHEHGIFHTDLKPDNILIFGTHDSRYRAKISDFGSSVVRNRAAPDGACTFGRDALGTAGYTAPELVGLSTSKVLELSNSELRKLDVFSFAVVLLETLSSCRIQKYPFDKAITMDSVRTLSFIKEHTGTVEWDKAITIIFHRCLQPASSRCDNFVEILTILQEGEHDLLAVTQASNPPDGDVVYSTYLAFLDHSNELIGTNVLDGPDSGDQGFDIDWLLKNYPIIAFEILFGLRMFKSDLNDLQSFPGMLRRWTDALPQDTAEYHLVSALLHVFGCAAIDFDRCCHGVLEAAKRGSFPARIIYRRFHEALYSIYSVDEDEAADYSMISPLAIKEIDPDLYDQLERLEITYPDNYLAHLLRFCETWSLAEQVYAKIYETAGLDSEDMNLIATWDAVGYSPIRNERIEDFIQTQTESLTGRLFEQGTAPSDADIELVGLLLSAAILFGDEKSSQLIVLCDFLLRIGFSLNFHFGVFGEDLLVSPLMLACQVGNAQAVRILHRAGDSQGYAMNRLKCSGDVIPLHFLFAFQDMNVPEMCDLLSQGICPEDTQSSLFIPAGQFCALFGTPLEFSFRIGSEVAREALWNQLYSTNKDFLRTVSLLPGPESINSLFSMHYEMSELDVLAIRCLSVTQPSTWSNFLASLSEDAKNRMQESFREKSEEDPETSPDRGLFYFQLTFLLTNMSQISHMLLHGPKYTERLVSQIRHGLEFFNDLDNPDFFLTAISLPIILSEPHFQVAFAKALGGSVALPDGVDYDTLKGVIFWFCVEAEQQGASIGRSLGFIVPRTQPVSRILDALAAAVTANDVPAFCRVVKKAVGDQVNLVEAGAIQFLGAKFARERLPYARKFLPMIFDIDVPSSFSRVARYMVPLYLEKEHTQTGRLLWDAVRHNNLDLVLLLIDWDPSILDPGFFSPGVFYLVCVNNKHLSLLKGLLESLDPSRSLEALNKCTKITGITALDVAAYHGSQQCLLQIAKIFTEIALHPDDNHFPIDILRLLSHLEDCARGITVIIGARALWKNPLVIVSSAWRSEVQKRAERLVASPGYLSISHFALELFQESPDRSQAIIASFKKYFGDAYDPVLLSEISNAEDDPEELPGSLVGEVRGMLVLGKAVKFWRQTLAVIGAVATTSIAVFYVRRPRA